MHIKKLLILTFVFLISIGLFGQNPTSKRYKASWKDTTFIFVKLQDSTDDNKVVVIEVGKKAIIFLSLKTLLLEVKGYLYEDAYSTNYKKIINYLDSASLKSDTILLSNYLNFRFLEYMISHLLIKGKAKIFYKKQNVFVETISHRLEKYGGNADRFFYLPDKRPFFAVQEYFGDT